MRSWGRRSPVHIPTLPVLLQFIGFVGQIGLPERSVNDCVYHESFSPQVILSRAARRHNGQVEFLPFWPVIRQRSANTGRRSAINLAVHIHAAASRGVSLSYRFSTRAFISEYAASMSLLRPARLR